MGTHERFAVVSLKLTVLLKDKSRLGSLHMGTGVLFWLVGNMMMYLWPSNRKGVGRTQ